VMSDRERTSSRVGTVEGRGGRDVIGGVPALLPMVCEHTGEEQVYPFAADDEWCLLGEHGLRGCCVRV
jgi:hypothetical protein